MNDTQSGKQLGSLIVQKSATGLYVLHADTEWAAAPGVKDTEEFVNFTREPIETRHGFGIRTSWEQRRMERTDDVLRIKE